MSSWNMNASGHISSNRLTDKKVGREATSVVGESEHVFLKSSERHLMEGSGCSSRRIYETLKAAVNIV